MCRDKFCPILGKYNFIVKEDVMLGHKVLQKGQEVDKARIEVIDKLQPPFVVKGVSSFFEHADFNQRFIKDFPRLHIPCENS